MPLIGPSSPYALSGADRLVVYAIGPGFGESVVVVTPDDDALVVDACTHGGDNLPAMLLRALDRKRIDLLLFSHPDSDHLLGGEALLREFDPSRVWVYPRAVSLRSLLAEVLVEDPHGTQPDALRAVRAMLAELEKMIERGVAETVQSNTAPWSSSTGACEVWPLAPSERDMREAQRQVRAIIENGRREPGLSMRIRDFLRGRRADAGDHPNLLSVALSLRWGARGLILAGDVEEGRQENSGWHGVLSRLRLLQRTERVRSMDVVKVAHHGSSNAFHEPAWALHRDGRDDLLAMICPFNRSGELPVEPALKLIRKHATMLAISSPSAEVQRRVGSAGWQTGAACIRHHDWDMPIVAAVIPQIGPPELHVAAGAGAWRA